MMAEHPPTIWRWACCRFFLRFRDEALLPPYKGAIFRGVLGQGLRRLVCLAPQANCRECAFAAKCLYTALFEPAAPPGATEWRKFSQAPRPFVLNPPLNNRQAFHPGDSLDFDLVLLGPAIEALPYFIYIFQEAGKKGLGRERRRYEVSRVESRQNGQAATIFEDDTIFSNRLTVGTGPTFNPEDNDIREMTLELLTPLRLKVKGDLATELSFPLFWENLSRRLGLLAAFYGEGREPDFAGLAEAAAEIEVKQGKLYWYDWERYSYSQKELMKLGGLRGTVTFAGKLGPFLPYLRMGEQVNVGQGTTFGLGRYRLVIGLEV